MNNSKILFLHNLLLCILFSSSTMAVAYHPLLYLWLNAGNDGGLTQYFMLEVVGGNPVNNEIIKDFQDNTLGNEISTMNDQVSSFIYLFLVSHFTSLNFGRVVNCILNVVCSTIHPLFVLRITLFILLLLLFRFFVFVFVSTDNAGYVGPSATHQRDSTRI